MRRRTAGRMFAAACGGAATLIAAIAAPPVAAQTTVEALEVIGHKSAPDGPALSYPVGYLDLDLRKPEGAKELRRRVAITAKYVCKRLGGMDKAGLADCRDRARRDGMIAADTVIHRARAHGARWTPGPPWKPPPGAR